MRISRYLFATVFLGALLLLSSNSVMADPFSVTITVDEDGHGTLTNTAGFFANLPFSLSPDPGPGGLASALTYGLLNPPDLVAGDLIILDSPGVISDIIRFNASNGTLVFYSRLGGGSLADTGFPTALYTNVFTVTEIAGGFIYTPIAGQPGFVAGAAGPVTYRITSDAVPEPTSVLLLGTGLTGAIGFLRRRLRTG